MKADENPHPNPTSVRHGPNPFGGRDLVICDLHGEFDTLEHALETLGFQPARDRLFTVGDLIDRGPRSADALEWLEAGRFAGSVRGNHEQMMIRALTCGEAVLMRMNGPGAMWLANGADWWYESAAVSDARRQGRKVPEGGVIDRWLEAIARMPYLALIEYGSRRVGLVHSPGAADYEKHWDQIWKQAESVPAPGARGTSRPSSSLSTHCFGETREGAQPGRTTRSSTKRSKASTSLSADTVRACGPPGRDATSSQSTPVCTSRRSDTSPSRKSRAGSRSTASPTRRRSRRGRPRRADR